MTHRWLLVALCSSLLLVSSGCVPLIAPTRREPPYPTIGPVINHGGGGDKVAIDFIASTNCAVVGETVIFTIQITNTASYPVTITGNPLLDIELHPAVITDTLPFPVQRWSESTQYPRQIKPMLAAGEVRHYEWHWVAEQRYAPHGSARELGGLFAHFISGDISDATGSGSPAGGTKSYLGVGGMTRPGGANGWFQCADMPRR